MLYKNHEAIGEAFTDYLKGQDSMVTVFEVHRDGPIGAVTFDLPEGSCRLIIGVRWKEGGCLKYRETDEIMWLKFLKRVFYLLNM